MIRLFRMMSDLRKVRIKMAGLVLCLGAVLNVAPAAADTDKKPAIVIQAASSADLVIYPRHVAPAMVVARNDSKLSAEITGRIVSIPVLIGQTVKKGTVLVSMDSYDFRLAVDKEKAVAKSLRARLELADYQLKRAKKLLIQQVVSDDVVLQRETELLVLRAESSAQAAVLAQAERRLNKTTIRAPYRAYVLERLGNIGELASPGTPLIRIVEALRSEVSARLHGQQIESLRRATSPEFVYDKNRYPVTMRAVTATIDTRERTQEIRLAFVKDMAINGASGELSWLETKPHLSPDLLVRRDKSLGVFLLKGARVDFYPIPDATEGRPALLDLSLDEWIVTRGRYRLQHGDKVTRE